MLCLLFFYKMQDKKFQGQTLGDMNPTSTWRSQTGIEIVQSWYTYYGKKVMLLFH